MIYTDGIHLVADDIKELHNFAKLINLNKCWFENNRIPHYDLMKSKKSRERMLKLAIENGAKLITSKEIICLKKS
jgi:nicotinic acid mononucleotide adenylyltransferase